MIKLLSFDLDNTLYDNQPVINMAESKNKEYLFQEFKRQNIKFDFDQFLRIRNELMSLKNQQQQNHENPLEDLTFMRQQALEEFCKPLKKSKTICSTALEIFLKYRSQVEVPAEIIQLLDSLNKRFAIVSVTNGNCDPYLTAMGNYFEKHYAPHHGYRAKPHTQMLDTIMQDFGLEPANILHIGDQIDTDGKAAENANCRFYYFSPFEKPQTVANSCKRLLNHLS